MIKLKHIHVPYAYCQHIIIYVMCFKMFRLLNASNPRNERVLLHCSGVDGVVPPLKKLWSVLWVVTCVGSWSVAGICADLGGQRLRFLLFTEAGYSIICAQKKRKMMMLCFILPSLVYKKFSVKCDLRRVITLVPMLLVLVSLLLRAWYWLVLVVMMMSRRILDSRYDI